MRPRALAMTITMRRNSTRLFETPKICPARPRNRQQHRTSVTTKPLVLISTGSKKYTISLRAGRREAEKARSIETAIRQTYFEGPDMVQTGLTRLRFWISFRRISPEKVQAAASAWDQAVGGGTPPGQPARRRRSAGSKRATGGWNAGVPPAGLAASRRHHRVCEKG